MVVSQYETAAQTSRTGTEVYLPICALSLSLMVKFTMDGETHSKTSLQRVWRERVRGIMMRPDASPSELAQMSRVPSRQGIAKKKSGSGRKRSAKSSSATPSRGRIELSDAQAEWFVKTACLFDKQRSKLYGANTRCPETSLRANRAFIDKASLGFGKYGGSKSGAKHLGNMKCVFFADRHDPTKFRAVSSTLGDFDKIKDDSRATKDWMRQAIDSQIERFRHDMKCGDPERYRCYLCNRQLGIGIESHVDHGVGETSFKRLAERFQTTECLGRGVVAADRKSGNSGTKRKWQDFHRKHCCLTLTCRKCNLKNK